MVIHFLLLGRRRTREKRSRQYIDTGEISVERDTLDMDVVLLARGRRI